MIDLKGPKTTTTIKLKSPNACVCLCAPEYAFFKKRKFEMQMKKALKNKEAILTETKC